jgi:hypothetical protein
MQEQLRLIPTDFKRYMYDRLPWEARMVGLMGPRGVGKSTMVMQPNAPHATGHRLEGF